MDSLSELQKLNFTAGVLENFKEDVNEYIKIDKELDQINKEMEPYREKINVLKNKKKEIHKSICSFMSSNNIDICNVPKQTKEAVALKYSKGEARVPFSQEVVRSCIADFFKKELDKVPEFVELSGEGKAEYICTYINNNRKRRVRESIRKVKKAVIDLEQMNMDYEMLKNL